MIDILQRLYQNCTPLSKYRHDATLALLTILRRIHVKNRKLEKIVTIVEQVLADYVALYRRIGFSDQEKQNIINSIVAILQEKGFKLSNEDVAQIEKIVDSKLLEKVE